ncbi:nucleoside deaminase [Brachybacterium phenoliresistens]|uniref:Cytosine deaminase n=1 Tax=Brachybacterium phenoliresistens TaxID=396014 RepID=Z9JQW4_9MICO|nr:nucleoside deaminase [Brachybacterium phenoliresistens]EWS80554.1 cytosine deaminase [Brachybacterium phenoliresistens]
MSTGTSTLASVMSQAVDACTAHVDAGGLPFVGVLVGTDGEAASVFGVNRVAETGDPMAHAEVVAMRDAMTRHGLDSLAGFTVLATGEPCGLCYRYALDRGIGTVHVAVDRDEVAGFGFDYRASYPAFGITGAARDRLYRPLAVPHGADPFTRYLHHRTSGRASARPGNRLKGTSS